MSSDDLELHRSFDRVRVYEPGPLSDGLTHGTGIGAGAPFGGDAAAHERVAALHGPILVGVWSSSAEPPAGAILIRTDDLVALLPLSHPLRNARSFTMECLEHETILGLADDLAVLRVAVSLPNVEAIKRAVNFGLGVGILPKRCVKPDDPSSEPAERFLMLGRKESVYLMHGDSQRLSKAAEVFVKAMVTTTDQKAVESGGTSTTRERRPASCARAAGTTARRPLRTGRRR